MVRETSTSREVLRVYLDGVAQNVRDKYGVDVWFGEIMGKRWSYIAGCREDGLCHSYISPCRIRLSERFGLISNGWDNIPIDESDQILSSLRGELKEI